MRHTIEFKESALRRLEGLDKPIRMRIARRIEALADAPRPVDVKVLKGGDGDLRIRVGDYRIVYRIDGKKLIILVIRIGHGTRFTATGETSRALTRPRAEVGC